MFSDFENVTINKINKQSSKPTETREDYRFHKRSQQKLLLDQIAMTMNFHFIEQITENLTDIIQSLWNTYIREV